MLLHLQQKDFEKEVLQSKQPVLVDFSAKWCNPCQMMSPVMEQLAADFEGKAKVAKIDYDESIDLSMKYNIMSVPCMIFFKNGEVKDQVIGVTPQEELSEKLSALL